MTLRVYLLFSLALAPVYSQAQQSITYLYQGSAFTTYGYPYQTTGFLCQPICQIMGSFSVSEPLPPNTLVKQLMPTSFSFADGYSTITNANASYFSFDVGTNTQGQIVKWKMGLIGPVPCCSVTEQVNGATVVLSSATIDFDGNYGLGTTNGDDDYYSSNGAGGPDAYNMTAGQWINLSIGVPKNNENDLLDQLNETATSPIKFQAETKATSGTVINWTAMLQYATSGGHSVPPVQKTFTTKVATDNIHPFAFTGMGGQLTTNANITVSGTAINAAQIQSVITGTQIPDSEITSQLISLYSGGATSNLMTGIAEVESSYAQFAENTLYGVDASWPNESFDGGSHIGLMMMETTSMARAFDWLTNTSEGVNFFTSQKLPRASTLMSAIIGQHTGLATLSGVQLENMALLLYGPYASSSLVKQYYIPSCQGGVIKGSNCVGGSWVWIVNTAGNPNGVAYANNVRSMVQ